MYVRGYLQGSENGRVVTIDLTFNSGHVGWLAWSPGITVKADPLKMIQANVDLNWPSIFREEDLL